MFMIVVTLTLSADMPSLLELNDGTARSAALGVWLGKRNELTPG